MKRPVDIELFESYVKNNKVIEKKRDVSEAEGLFKGSMRKFKNMEKLGIERDTATDYFENLYESLKVLIQFFMSLKGYHPYSHEATIAFGIDYLDLSSQEANRFNKFRKLRNDISYRGDVVTIEEAKNIRNLFNRLRKRLKPKFENWKDKKYD